MRFAFRTGASGGETVVALTFAAREEATLILQTSAPGTYLDEAHALLHADALAAVQGPR